MRNLLKIMIIIISFSCLTACSNNNYDIYVNGIGYRLEDELNLEVTLNTSETNIEVCPIIKIEMKDSDKKIADNIEFSSENIEFINLYAKEFSEVYNDDYWSLQASLYNDSEELNFSDGDVILKAKIKIKEKGNYKIFIEENESKCSQKYNDALKLNISKSETLK